MLLSIFMLQEDGTGSVLTEFVDADIFFFLFFGLLAEDPTFSFVLGLCSPILLHII